MVEKDKSEKISYGTVSLPIPLINKIKEKMKGTGMNSVSAYVTFILRQVLSTPNNSSNEILSKTDEDMIRERMKNLGYL